MKIALAGNPNSGKTTLFNAITGKLEHVGNWAGVTVSKKQGELKKSFKNTDGPVLIVDLPGAYSMSPFTSEESITGDFVKNENPDVIINVVDALNLNRSLFFTTQLLELGIPVIVALNKSDLLEKKKNSIDIKALSGFLKCPVVFTSASRSKDSGLEELLSKAVVLAGKSQERPYLATEKVEVSEESVRNADKKRFEFVKDAVGKIEKRTVKSSDKTAHDKADKILAHKWLGLPVFAAVMWGVFAVSQTYLGPFLADIFGAFIDQFYGFVEGLLGESVSPLLSALLLDGIIGGVGAVVGFLPLIMVLFWLLALLEDCGYMARVALIMDRFFKKVGLSGRSIIPMVIGTGCAIPGIMATRTIKNERQRRTTAMLTPFMPCGAKLPVIALFAGVFFKDSAWVGTLMYFLGILIIIVGALIVVNVTGEKKNRSFFIMELPEYRVPSVKRATLSMLSRGKAFVIKAGTIILVCNAAVHIMQTFNWSFEIVAEGAEHTSILASLSAPFAFILIPLGFGIWQLAAAAITGFIAKENVVGTLAVVYGISNFIDTEELALVTGGSAVAGIMGITSVVALSYLIFNLFTPPCFAAIGAMNSEMGSRKWLWAGIAFQFSMGYVASFLTYQIGTLLVSGTIGTGFIPGLIAVLLIVAVLFFLIKRNERQTSFKLSPAS